MKGVDFAVVKALLKKQRIERIYPYRRGNFDVVGFLLKLALVAAIIALFAVFFGKFLDIFLKIREDGVLDRPLRSFQILTIVYSIVIVVMTLSGLSQINKELFAADDIKLFSAMPVGASELYASKLVNIYLGQLVISLAVVLTVNVTFALHAQVDWKFWLTTVVSIALLPLIAIALASLFAVPVHFLRLFLKDKFVLNFLLVSAALGVMFWLYSRLLDGVEQLLLGRDISYFFNEKLMDKIAALVAWQYPARWFAGMLLGQRLVESWLCSVFVALGCSAAALVVIRLILQRALQSRIAGSVGRFGLKGKLTKRGTPFTALLKKEFMMIFRTPSYMFSCFSVAIIMPLMVYFCMSIGSSLTNTLVGINFELELAIFLTVLFGSLTNIFCATNISRDGYMFYVVKAFPLSYKSVFMAKVTLCISVSALSQLVSAVLLGATGKLPAYAAVFVFVIGLLFSFVNIAVATRYDFNHARFSTEDDGEIRESSNASSVITVIGILISFVLGALIFGVKAVAVLKLADKGYTTYLICGAIAVVSAVAAGVYLFARLGDKYYRFEGGGI